MEIAVERGIILLYVVILSVWIALSAANQFRLVADRLSRYDQFSLLPRWTFFAPNPGIHDQFIVWRTADKSLNLSTRESWGNNYAEKLSQWRELEHPALDGCVIPLLWHPSRRASKSISDLIQGLREPGEGSDLDKLVAKLSFSYILLCEMVSLLTEQGRKYQWAIVRGHGFQGKRSLQFIYMSDFHAKDDQA